MDRPSHRRGGGSWRAARRASAHEQAHADLAQPPEPPADLPLIPSGKAPLLTTSDELNHLIADLRAAGSFAYDSEFIGELTYFPKLCLIQVATPQQVSLIDALSGQIDLRPFWELLCDPTVEKIVHAGEQDVEPVVRHVGREAANVLDVQLAAGLAAMAYPVSLSKLVHEVLGVRLGKGLTFTHWDQRPLSAMQLRYAADDVRYLPALRVELGKRLDGLNHTAWAKEESEAMCRSARQRFDPQSQYLKIRGATSLTPQSLAVLRELTIWRDAAAKAHDVPPRSFVRDEVLLELSRSPVKSVQKLDRVRGLPRPVEHAHGAEIVEVTLRVLALPAQNLPHSRPAEPTPAERFRIDALWAAMQCLCIGRSIDPALVASRQEVIDLYQHLFNGASPDELRILQGWRAHAVGNDLLKLVRGETDMRLRWENGSLKRQTA